MTTEKWITAMKEAGILFPPCKIGDTVYAVGVIDEPFFDAYTAEAIMYDGEKWYVTEDHNCWNEFGTDEALTDPREAMKRFHEIKAKWSKERENG